MTMNAPYMPLFISDWLSDTNHLTTIEQGAYLLLVMNYWQRQKPLPADARKLARIARMTDAEWADSADTLAEFFVDDGDVWRHSRVDSELAIVADKLDKARTAGQASANARRANAQRPSNTRSTDVQPLGKARQGEERTEDTGKPASSGAGQPEIDLIEAERRCLNAAGRDKLGPFTPIAEVLQRGLLDLENDILPLIRARSSHDWSSWKYMTGALRDAEIAKPDPNAPKPPPKVFVAVGTPQWDAWTAFNKKPFPTGKDGNGWFQPSEWPPGFIPAASPPPVA